MIPIQSLNSSIQGLLLQPDDDKPMTPAEVLETVKQITLDVLSHEVNPSVDRLGISLGVSIVTCRNLLTSFVLNKISIGRR